jgi:6-pyruvoyltetrahydropterin/6-carboxytetrahydropterin synthase
VKRSRPRPSVKDTRRDVQTLKVRHNIEVAHRLSLMPGKCQNIHGHSMWVCAEFEGAVNPQGVLLGMEFGDVKFLFRNHLDETYDHHLLLNASDDWAGYDVPGLQRCEGDPTTENIAKWIGLWTLNEFDTEGLVAVKIEVWETSVNGSTWEVRR